MRATRASREGEVRRLVCLALHVHEADTAGGSDGDVTGLEDLIDMTRETRDLWRGFNEAPPIRFGELALARGRIRPEDLDRALVAQANAGKRTPLGQLLIEQGTLSTADCVELLIEQESLADGLLHRRIGDFLLLYELGRGGMGVVWKAWDTRLNRAAALKMVNVDRDSRPEILLREARTAAQLAHPNIVPIYEIVEHEGSPCVAMGLVEGTTVGSAAPGLPLRRILEIVRDAARAVHYAHAQGVVHRDLKPENLMLDRDGQVYVMDFGLAKASRPGASLSQSGAVIGTPVFMSPEQARGERKRVGPRSDVYGLGATLYALIAGRPPFEGESPGDVMMAVLSREPVPLTKIRPQTHRDIQTIVRKAMDKDSARRYESAGAMADDLERFLRGDGIVARPSSMLTRAMKRLRRHSAWAAVVIAGAFAIGLGLWAAQAWRKDAARRRAMPHLEEARAALEEADRRLYREGAIEPMWEDVARAEKAVERALSIDPSLPEAYFIRAQARQLRGDVRGTLADFDRALELNPAYGVCGVRRALFLLTQKLLVVLRLKSGIPSANFAWEAEELALEIERATASGSLIPERDRTYARIGAEIARKNYAEADRLCVEALERSEDGDLLRLHGFVLHHLRRSDEALQRFEGAVRHKHHDAYARLALSLELGRRRRWRESLEHLEIVKRLLPQDPKVLALQGQVLCMMGDYEAAITACARAAEIDPDEPLNYYNRGFSHWKLKHLEEALADYDRAVEGIRKGRWEEGEASVRGERAKVLSELGRDDEALADWDAAERLAPSFFETYYNRGRFYKLRGDRIRAIEQFKKSLELNPDAVKAQCTLAGTFFEMGNYEDARKGYDRAIELDPAEGRTYSERARCWMRLEKWSEARADLDKAVGSLPADATVRGLRGHARLKLGDLDGALRDLTEAIRLDPDQADAHLSLAYVAKDRSRWPEAEQEAGRAAQLYEKRGDSENLSNALVTRAIARAELGRRDQARADLDEAVRRDPKNERAYETRAHLRAPTDPKGATEDLRLLGELNAAWSWFQRGLARIGAGDLPGAEQAFSRSVELQANANAWSNLGAVRVLRGDYEGAEAAFTRALERAPNSGELLAERANARLLGRKLDAALADAERAVQVSPTLAAAHAMLGRVRAAREDSAGALQALARALELDPSLARSLTRLIDDLRKRGKP